MADPKLPRRPSRRKPPHSARRPKKAAPSQPAVTEEAEKPAEPPPPSIPATEPEQERRDYPRWREWRSKIKAMSAAERRNFFAMWRIERFSKLRARYEARDDQLEQAGDIIDWVAALIPDIPREAIARRFIHGATHGAFGWRHRRPNQPHRPAQLIDLDSHMGPIPFEPVQYALRPGVMQVEMRWSLLYATRTTWVEWLSVQGLPVPRELIGTTIDHVPVPAEPPASPTKQRQQGGRPSTVQGFVTVFWKNLSAQERERASDHALAESYKAADPSCPGDQRTVRRIIGKLRSGELPST
jgi:hypothetical protein